MREIYGRFSRQRACFIVQFFSDSIQIYIGIKKFRAPKFHVSCSGRTLDSTVGRPNEAIVEVEVHEGPASNEGLLELIGHEALDNGLHVGAHAGRA